MWLPHYLRSPAVDAGAATDPNWSSVVLLVGNNNGANGTSTFTDQSTSAKTVTNVGTPTWSNTNVPASATTVIRTTSGNYLSVASSTDFALGTTWTIRGWFYANAWPTGSSRQIVGAFTNGGTTNWFFGHTFVSPGKLIFLSPIGQLTSVTTISAGTPYHFEVNSNGTNRRLFINGTQDASDANGGSSIINDRALTIGADTAGNIPFDGWCVIEIYKGVCLHTSNFTPPTFPVPTS